MTAAVRLTTVRCGKCPQDIAWVKTTNGKPMPLDPDPNEAGNVIVRWEAGQLVAQVLVRSDKVRPPGVAFMPHWATCSGIPGNRDRAARPPKPPKPVRPEPDALF